MENKKIYVTRSSMPSFEEYVEAIRPLWESRLITNMGKYHKELESKLSEYLDVPYVSLMVNGHMSLEMAIQAFEFPIGSEIITTPFTFISTTHAIVRNYLKPVFCDVKQCDGTIDERKIEELITEKTVAILPVHVYGNICNIEAIQAIADKYNLKVIYDAAHSFGEIYNGKSVANFGDASCFSFHATKVFNTIEGGAVAFDNALLYEKLYDLKNFGIRGEELVVDVGANSKMNEFSAIMGLCNLKHFEDVINERKVKYEYYVDKICEISGVDVLEGRLVEKKNYAYLPVVISEEYKYTRDELYTKLSKNSIFARKYFYPLTCDQDCYKNYNYDRERLEVSRKLSKNILVLPFYQEIEYEVIDRIIDIMR